MTLIDNVIDIVLSELEFAIDVSRDESDLTGYKTATLIHSCDHATLGWVSRRAELSERPGNRFRVDTYNDLGTICSQADFHGVKDTTIAHTINDFFRDEEQGFSAWVS